MTKPVNTTCRDHLECKTLPSGMYPFLKVVDVNATVREFQQLEVQCQDEGKFDQDHATVKGNNMIKEDKFQVREKI